MQTYRMLAERVARRFAQLPVVQAIAIAGSQTSGRASQQSDIDLYIYTNGTIPADERLAIGHEFAEVVQIIDYWGPGLEWDDPETGIHLDVIFFEASWMADQVARVLTRHEAWMGYTTCFWHTVRVSQILYDPHQWFAQLQVSANVPYPDELVKAIVTLNFPPLRDIFPSYRAQIVKASSRDDVVSLNHRIAGLLASYFDILFAVNRLPHPGEKRLLEIAETLCPLRPVTMRDDVLSLLSASVNTPEKVGERVDALIDGLEALLKRERLIP